MIGLGQAPISIVRARGAPAGCDTGKGTLGGA
jgi:hypothetical protein